MGRPRKNIFADAAKARDKEQGEIEYKIFWEGETEPIAVHSVEKKEKVPTTVILSRANHMAIKRCALEKGTTFSEMINEWIEEKCAEFIKK